MLSSRNLVQWYAEGLVRDASEGTVLSTSVWIYKGLLLCSALWLTVSFVHWLRFGWTMLREEGALRHKGRAGPHELDDAMSASRQNRSSERERARIS
jgi:hypothetical protein